MILNLLVGNKEYNRLWKIVDQKKFLTRQRFINFVKQAEKNKKSLSQLILEDETLPEDKALGIFSKFFNLPVVCLRQKSISSSVINLIPKEVALENQAVVFKKVKDTVQVATATPENTRIIEFIRRKTGLTPQVFITTPKDIRLAANKYYNGKFSDDIAQIIDLHIDQKTAAVISSEKMAELIPVIKVVNNMIETGLLSGASDVHIEPGKEKLKVRMRVDGILQNILELPQSMLPAIVTRIKILANLKIDEHMAPQDGRFQYKYNDEEVALRVSIIPTLFGPKVALRLLEMKDKMLTLKKLGLNKNHLQILAKEVYASHGMILVTGPTGSGKTTTLYTILRQLNTEAVNICTIEDPIEYGIENINQMQVRPKSGLTFASGLRALLRQDPNILMVGEVRDIETANIAVNSAMTGHLVLSTLHTNNAFLAPQRLMEMGAQPYLVISVLNVIIGQRLVRKLCPHCKEKLPAAGNSPEFLSVFEPFLEIYHKLKRVGLIAGEPVRPPAELYRAVGCPKCAQSGYKGRVGIYEVIQFDDELRKFILKNPNETAVRDYLLKKDVITMAEDGWLKVFDGQTTIEEVLRVTKE